ncbi:MAG: hypothetical protein OXR73_11435 [Myxococcales bacterium]|nr:hypothetical protein [Myxococcales bacterium]
MRLLVLGARAILFALCTSACFSIGNKEGEAEFAGGDVRDARQPPVPSDDSGMEPEDCGTAGVSDPRDAACPRESRDATAPVELDDAALPREAAGVASNGGPVSTDDAAASCSGAGKSGVIDKLDLLLVVDDSNSMQEEQEALRQALPALLERLTSGIDRDGQSSPAAQDLHLAVVSTDMGLPSVEGVKGCVGLGRDGVLVDTPSASLEACGGQSYPESFLSFEADAGNTEDVAHELGCLASLGTDVGTSRLRPIDFVRAIGEIIHIYRHYRLRHRYRARSI